MLLNLSDFDACCVTAFGRKRPLVTTQRHEMDSTIQDGLIAQGLDIIQEAISIFDADLRLVLCNRRFIDMFSLDAETCKPGARFEEINQFLARRGEFGPGDPNDLAQERVDRARKFEPHYFERTRPNGQRISIEGNPLRDGGCVTIYSDITENWQNEQVLKAQSDLLSDKLLRRTGQLSESNRALEAANRALQKTSQDLRFSEDRMRAITRALPAHVAYLDRKLRYTFSNNRFSDVTQLPRGDLTGKDITEAFPPQVLARVRPRLEQALEGESQSFTYEVENRDGAVQTVRTTFSPDTDSTGHVAGVFVMSLNISAEVAKTELELRAKRMETTAQLTSGLAHDFSNILTIILGNLKRLEKTADTEQMDLLKSTNKAARRGTRIIDNLMTHIFRQKLDVTQTNVSELLRELLRLFLSSLPPHITLEADLGRKDIWFELDQGALQDAFLNVLFNASDAIQMHKGQGKISVSVEKITTTVGADLKITVSDDGPGFDDAVLVNASEPFFTTKPQGKGSGLGLAMVRGFVEQCNGTLDIANRPDGGAQISLTIREPEIEALDVKALPTSEVQSNQLVLVLDDDGEMRSLMREYLTAMDLSVIEADTPAEALSLVENIPEIEVVVSDIVMPGESNGYATAQLLRRLKPNLAILLVPGLPRGASLMEQANADFK